MPFNGSGTFTIVNTFTPNTTISSSQVNGNFSDIAAGLSDCLTRDGQAGMTATLDIASGTAGNPGLEFTSQQGTGLYLATAGSIGVAIASALAFTINTASTANGAGLIGQAGAVLLPIGIIQDYAGTSAPTGWLLCYGQEVSQTTYTQLYSVIGTAWGTASTSTGFILPDLRGRATYGKDNMGGSAASRITVAGGNYDGTVLGTSGGAQLRTITTAQMPAHSHGVTDPGHTHTSDAARATGGSLNGGVVPTPSSTLATIATATTGITIDSEGSGSSLPTLGPSAIVNKIIFAGHG